MTQAATPPRLGEWLLGRCAGPAWRDDILGDLQERLCALDPPSPAKWYWHEILRALPWLAVLRARQAARAFTAPDGLVVVLSLTMVIFTEFVIARPFAWPFSMWLLPVSPLTVTATCMAAYVILHAITALAFVAGLRLLGCAAPLRRLWSGWTPAIVAISYSLPALYYLAIPASYDGTEFRLYQLAILIGTVGVTAVVRPPLPRVRA